MNSEQLSERLKRVGEHVPKNARLADIGSDHAYLPCYLAKQQRIEFAIAGEVVKGPFQSAERQVRTEGLTDIIEVRMGDGLDVIRAEDHISTITIAGMGGPLIAKIVERGKIKANLAERLILQPNVHALAIREWAEQNGWKLIHEEILEENQKIYEILVLEKGTMKLTDQERLLGPLLMHEKSATFAKKWTRESTEWKRILQNLPDSDRPELAEKRQELEWKIKLVEEALE
ncbi:tRNA (adenine22-N1)-methyltransferase [Chryseomicrobium aureum]|uniref:tRNA (adenine(22)-N(1))-methyltransferase n=1 Tax=Chryseomicrobium aureum TaxID=1441723 RepID=UPI00195AC9AF|nr:tRNA (adenine(22)-N(1))-methyltransferase TrmK [Chryseomicrobium aureum]MBM7707752.1 tRNA (adenine22-N1)-methyltransferase [Chryseomicrobium aureum]